MNWTFLLGVAWMFALTTWLNYKEWGTGISKTLLDYYSTKILNKHPGKLMLYLISFVLLILGVNSSISQRTAFVMGVAFLFITDLIWRNHVLFEDIRNHIEKVSAKKALKLQQIFVLVTTLVYLFILK